MCSTETWRGAKGNLPKTASQGAFTQWWGKDSSLKCYCQITTRWNVSNKSKASSKQKQKNTLGSSMHTASSQSGSERWHLPHTAYLLGNEEWQFILIMFL